MVVAEEGKRDGPETYIHSHFQVPLEGEELGLQKEEARSGPIYPIPSPPSSCSLALREFRIWVAIRGSEGKGTGRVGTRTKGVVEDAHPAVPHRYIRLHEPAH